MKIPSLESIMGSKENGPEKPGSEAKAGLPAENRVEALPVKEGQECKAEMAGMLKREEGKLTLTQKLLSFAGSPLAAKLGLTVGRAAAVLVLGAAGVGLAGGEDAFRDLVDVFNSGDHADIVKDIAENNADSTIPDAPETSDIPPVDNNNEAYHPMKTSVETKVDNPFDLTDKNRPTGGVSVEEIKAAYREFDDNNIGGGDSATVQETSVTPAETPVEKPNSVATPTETPKETPVDKPETSDGKLDSADLSGKKLPVKDLSTGPRATEHVDKNDWGRLGV